MAAKTSAHVLAGCVETGLDSGLGETCGRLAGVWSEIPCLTFRGPISWWVPESSAADMDTGLAEYWEDGLFSPLNDETLTGSERDQLRKHAQGTINNTVSART